MKKYIKSKIPILVTSVILALLLYLFMFQISDGFTLNDLPFFVGVMTVIFYFTVNMVWATVIGFINLTKSNKVQFIFAFIAVIIGLKLVSIIQERFHIPSLLIFPVLVMAAVASIIIYVKLKQRNSFAVNLISQYIQEDKLDMAIEQFEELKSKGKLNLYNKGVSYYNMYICYLYKGDVEKAGHIYSQAEKYIKQLNRNINIRFYLMIWKAYEKLQEGKYEECQAFLDRTCLFVGKEHQEEESDVYRLIIGSVHARRGQADEAKNLLIPLITFSQSPVIQNRAQEELNRLKEENIPDQ